MKSEEIINSIIWANKKIGEFWSNSKGWAPDNAASLLSKSRLDWQISLSHSLKHWVVNSKISDGDLILAWVNLGALLEGTLKLFLSVYYNDYQSDPHIEKLKSVEPDILMLEKLKIFFKKKKLIEDKWIIYIEAVQRYRNAIHAFRNRDIGDFNKYKEYLDLYLQFLHEINQSLPYPDEFGYLEIYPKRL